MRLEKFKYKMRNNEFFVVILLLILAIPIIMSTKTSEVNDTYPELKELSKEDFNKRCELRETETTEIVEFDYVNESFHVDTNRVEYLYRSKIEFGFEKDAVDVMFPDKLGEVISAEGVIITRSFTCDLNEADAPRYYLMIPSVYTTIYIPSLNINKEFGEVFTYDEKLSEEYEKYVFVRSLER